MKCNQILIKTPRYIGCYSMVFFMLFVAVVVTGCATPAVHHSLSTELIQQNVEVNVVSEIPADEIVAHFQSGTYTSAGGGLLWILIDKGINKSRAASAEERIGPLLEASAGIDFRKQFWAALEETLTQAQWLKTKSIKHSAENIDKEAQFNAGLPLLTLNTAYELSPNAQVLRVQTGIRFYLSDSGKPDYFGAVVYISEKIGKNDEEDEEAIEFWAMDEAAALSKALSEGIAQNMQMLKYDLLDGPHSTALESKEEISANIRDPITGNMREYEGVLVNEIDNRMLVREEGGNLFSIPRSIIEGL